MWKEQRRYAQKSNYYSCDIFHNHGCHENGKNGQGIRISGKADPDPFRDQCPVRTGMEMRGAIRGGNRKISEKKELAWDGIYRVLV